MNTVGEAQVWSELFETVLWRRIIFDPSHVTSSDVTTLPTVEIETCCRCKWRMLGCAHEAIRRPVCRSGSAVVSVRRDIVAG